MENIKEMLSKNSFFKGLKEDQLELLSGCGSNIHYKKGERVMEEGTDADYFYVVRKGKIALDINAVERGGIRIQTIEEGDILGWSWLIPPHVWSFSAHAVEDTNVTALDGKCLRKKCEEDHDLGYELLKRFSTVLAGRLERARMQLLDVYGTTSNA